MNYVMVFASGDTDISEWAKHHHDGEDATDVTKSKLEVRMKLCCNSCIEKIGDAIRNMPGVSNLKTDKTENLLTIYETPDGGPNHKQLLKKLKKVDKRAEILKRKSSTEEKETAQKKSNTTLYYVMTPWSYPQGYFSWPFFTNFNYVQHIVCCGQCLGYADVVCSNCGRPSEVGALQE